MHRDSLYQSYVYGHNGQARGDGAACCLSFNNIRASSPPEKSMWAYAVTTELPFHDQTPTYRCQPPRRDPRCRH